MSSAGPSNTEAEGVAGRGAAEPLLRAVLAYRWVVVLVALATFVGAIVFVAHRTPRYVSTDHVLFTPLATGDGAQGLPLVVSSADPTRDAQTGITLLGGPTAAALAARRMGSGWSAHRVTGATTIVQTGESNILSVQGRAQSPALATRLASNFAQASLQVRLAQLTRDALSLSRTVPAVPGPNDAVAQAERSEINLILAGADPNFSIQGPAGAASSTATPAAAILLLAALGGVALGIVAAILFDVFSNRIRDGEELHDLYPVPVLGYLPRLSSRTALSIPPLFSRESPSTPRRSARESLPIPRLYTRGGNAAPSPSPRQRSTVSDPVLSDELMAPAHLLATRLLADARGGRVVLATGASTGDGTTTTMLHLARALVGLGRSVLFIDCDLRTAGATRRLALGDHRPALNQLLTGQASVRDSVTSASAIPGLQLIPAGGPPASTPHEQWPSIMLGERMRGILQEARGAAEYVLIDASPLGRETDFMTVLADVEEVLVVARPGHTRRAELTLLRDLLDTSGAGAVKLVVVGERSPSGGPRVVAAEKVDAAANDGSAPAAPAGRARRRSAARGRAARSGSTTPAQSADKA